MNDVNGSEVLGKDRTEEEKAKWEAAEKEKKEEEAIDLTKKEEEKAKKKNKVKFSNIYPGCTVYVGSKKYKDLPAIVEVNKKEDKALYNELSRNTCFEEVK